MKEKFSIAFLILLHIFFQNCHAQNNEIKFNLVEGNNGEPLGNINGISQDPYGYMWFSGQQARCLYRYDGNRMIAFKHDSLNANSLGGIDLETVYADSNGIIWIGFRGGGMDKYFPETRIFKHYQHVPSNPGSLSSGMVTQILRDHLGRLWVGTANGLDRLDEETGTFIHYRNEAGNRSSLSSNVVRAIFEDRKGVLWIGTGFPFDNRTPDDGGLNRMEPDGTFTRFLHDPKNPNSLINNKVISIFEDSRSVFWVGTAGDGLHTMDREKGSFERHLYNPARPDQLSRPPLARGTSHDILTFINEDSSGSIWIGTYNSGLNRYDPFTKKITHYEASNGFPDKSGWRAYTSRDGVLWLSATEKTPNLYRVDPSSKLIRNIITGNRVFGIHEEKKGIVWVGGENTGLKQYDGKKNLAFQLNIDLSDSINLQTINIYSIFQNQQDTLWLSTSDGIIIYNKINRHLSRIHFTTEKLFSQHFEFIKTIQDKQGFKWFATFGGLIRYNSENGTAKQFLPDAKDSGSISSTGISCVIEDRSGDIWAGAYVWTGAYDNGAAGINRLNKKTGRFSHYLNGQIIICLYEDSKGTIWAGTAKGLYRFDKVEDRFTSFFDPQSEISVVYVNGIIEDDLKNLWISTQSSIVKINAERTQNLIYGKEYGIRPNSLFQGGIEKTAKNEILAGFNNGFYALNANEMALNIKPFQIILTDFFINDLRVFKGGNSPLLKRIEETNAISLEYNQNNISFHFAAIDYRAPESNKYYAMLENYDNAWRDGSADKSASFINVPPGKYVFRIKVFNINGIKVEKDIQILINQPWWKTWWAYSIYGLFLLTASFGMHRFLKQRTISIERQRAQVKELAQSREIEKAYTELKATQAQLIQSEKMASLGELTAGIAHEIQNPLNFVNNFSEVNKELLAEMKDELDKGNMDEAKGIANDIIANEDKINHHGKRADAIVKGMLQHSRTSTTQKEPADINALADEYLRLSYHGIRAREKSFNVTIRTDFDERIGKINIIPQDIGRVLLNLYNNAFYAVSEKKKQNLSGYEPVVAVSAKKLNGKIEVSIKDNGNGIAPKILDKIFQPFFTTKPTGQGTGLGLSLSYDMIKAHGGEIKVDSKEFEGTIFTVVLPC